MFEPSAKVEAACLDSPPSLRRFIGTEGYDLDELRTDLARFGFLPGTDDGTQLFDLNQR